MVIENFCTVATCVMRPLHAMQFNLDRRMLRASHTSFASSLATLEDAPRETESLCLDYYPFPTKIFAMFYFLQSGPRPMYILKQCGCAVPSLKQLKAFKLPVPDA
ncbi:hypothetical protein EMCRGX_G025421 [Ephydatia muelleri]